MSAPLAVLGGLFDPVHKGHVSAARFALEFLALGNLKMIPCHLPNHKSAPATSPQHRLAMLELAIAAYPQIEVDAIELQSERVSYTVDTLAQLKKQHGQLVFVLGADSFNSLPQWHEWERILDLSHLLVLSRHGVTLSPETQEAVGIDSRRVESSEQMLAASNGKIIQVEGFDFDMASKDIREKLARGDDVSRELDATVAQYIQDNNLYQI